MELKGIDVSYFQGNIDWPTVAENQIDFAMVRATYGTNGIDQMFAKNMEEIKNTNIAPGAYHYCYAMNSQEAIEEANHFIENIKPYKLTYPAALDIEESSIAELGKDTVTDIIVSFLDTVKSAGYTPILYVDLNWINNYIDLDKIKSFDIWLSEWGPKMNYTENVTIWQYSSEGSVPGIDSSVDMDISFKDYASISESTSSENESSESNSYENESSESDSSDVLYTVKSGDTLWSIAEKLLGNGNRYREIMALNNLTSDTIYPGQTLKIPQNQDSNTILYKVESGDTLWNIAKRFLGSGEKYREIMDLNGLTSDTIYPGQILKISTDSESIPVYYTVKSGDTLWSIAKRFLGSGEKYTEIMKLNNLSSDTIHPGQTLKI